MKRLTLLALCAVTVAATPALAQTARTGQSPLVGAFAAPTLQTSPGRPQTAGVGFACPNEFVCDGVEHFFHRIEGDCVTDPEQGIFCTGPDSPVDD